MHRRPDCDKEQAAENAYDLAIVEERQLDTLPRIEDCIASKDIPAYLESLMEARGMLPEYRELLAETERREQMRPKSGVPLWAGPRS